MHLGAWWLGALRPGPRIQDLGKSFTDSQLPVTLRRGNSDTVSISAIIGSASM